MQALLGGGVLLETPSHKLVGRPPMGEGCNSGASILLNVYFTYKTSPVGLWQFIQLCESLGVATGL